MGKKKAFLESFRDLLAIYNIDSVNVFYHSENNERSLHYLVIDSKGERIMISVEELLEFCNFKNPRRGDK